jgi:hypothetical protein
MPISANLYLVEYVPIKRKCPIYKGLAGFIGFWRDLGN